MCGIVGVIDETLPASEVLPIVQRMTAEIVHRGPDDDGFFVADGVGLGMRRLSIIDLAGGKQPIANEDGSVVVVFNGEIYNYRELAERLAQQGHRLATASDTEVIVHLYEQYGDNCVDHLRGMFAFALWDARRRRLLVARDRLGVKPLYYTQRQGRLIFGSEIKALLAAPGRARRAELRGHQPLPLAEIRACAADDVRRHLFPSAGARAGVGGVRRSRPRVLGFVVRARPRRPHERSRVRGAARRAAHGSRPPAAAERRAFRSPFSAAGSIRAWSWRS